MHPLTLRQDSSMAALLKNYLPAALYITGTNVTPFQDQVSSRSHTYVSSSSYIQVKHGALLVYECKIIMVIIYYISIITRYSPFLNLYAALSEIFYVRHFKIYLD